MMTRAAPPALAAFTNEPYADFSKPEVWADAQAALARVRSEFGEEHPLWIAGASHRTGDLLTSLNPSRPSEAVGRHPKANAELAARAIEDAHAYFPEWARSPAEHHACLARRPAALVRERNLESEAC